MGTVTVFTVILATTARCRQSVSGQYIGACEAQEIRPVASALRYATWGFLNPWTQLPAPEIYRKEGLYGEDMSDPKTEVIAETDDYMAWRADEPDGEITYHLG
jgi:hypothetical protein